MAIRALCAHALAFLIFFQSLSSLASPGAGEGAVIRWEKPDRVSVRGNITACNVFFSPSDALPGEDPDSLGVVMAGSHDPAEFETNLKSVIQSKGAQAFAGGTLYVTGVEMGAKTEAEARQNYESLLESQGLLDVDVVTLSVPKAYAESLTEGLTLALQKLRYFFPSLVKDAQKPLKREFYSGLAVTAGVEAFNLVYLVNQAVAGKLPSVDAATMIGLHLATLGFYEYHSKSMVNWLFREYRANPRSFSNRLSQALGSWGQWLGSESTKGPSPALLFAKQMGLSFPFVLNYSVVSRLSELRDFLATHTLAQSVEPFMREIATFVTSQSLTMVFQTLFYKTMITEGLNGWMNRQQGTANVTDARTLRKWISLPILAIDAWLLAMASQLGGSPILSAGPFDLYWGHVGLGAFVGFGMWFRNHSGFLDKILGWYQKRFAKSKPNHAATPESAANDAIREFDKKNE